MNTSGKRVEFKRLDGSGECAAVSWNYDTDVVVMREGSWGDDAVVTRARNRGEAEVAFKRYVDKCLARGFIERENRGAR